MKKIKLLTPILGLTAISSALMPLASCSNNAVDTTIIPTEGLNIIDVTLHGFKEDFEYKNYSKLVIPSNVKIIDTDAFKGLFDNTKVNEVIIPGNVETIRSGAFANNTNIKVYDFSQYTVDQIYALEIEEGAFGDMNNNGVYSFFKFSDNWSDTQKNAFKDKLTAAGVPAYCFVEQTEGNVEIAPSTSKEQVANGGEATNTFNVSGHYSRTLKYEAVLTVVEASEGVDVEHNVTPRTSEDFKTVYVDAKMVAKDGHKFNNDDYVCYKVTLICYTESESSNEYVAQWSQTIETFKLTYHTTLLSITANQPTKWKYKLGETFDPTGLSVNATFSNEEKTLNWDGVNVYTNIDNRVFSKDDVLNGVQGVAYCKYEDTIKQAPFTIEMENSISEIKIVSLPVWTWYEVESELKFDPTGLQLEVDYVSPTGTTSKTVNYDDENLEYSCDTLDLKEILGENQKGTHEIKVTYKCPDTGMVVTTSFNIKVNESNSSFNGVKWKYVVPAINEFETNATPTDQNAKDLIKALGVNVPTSETETDAKALLEKYLVGLTGSVLINGQEHNIRCIGAMHDTITGTSTKAALTFELSNLLSDTNGEYMLCQWDDVNATDYLNSELRACLTGQGEGVRAWYHISDFEAWIWEASSETRPVTDIIKQYSPALFRGIKSVDKEVYVATTSNNLSKVSYNDKLFVTTPTEMCATTPTSETFAGSAYKYWTTHTNNSDRIKDDVKHSNPFEEGGFYYWMLSSYEGQGGTSDTTYDITPSGSAGWNNTRSISGVSFAYCI